MNQRTQNNIESDFRKKLSCALDQAAVTLFKNLKEEQLYAFSLYTSGEGYFQYVCASANTEQGLITTSKKYSIKYPEYEGDVGIKKLRWSVPDWKYHNFSTDIASIELPNEEIKRRDVIIYKGFINCLKKLQETELFKTQKLPVVFLVTCGDMSREFFFKGLKLLNPPEIVNWYINEYTPLPFIERLKSLHSTEYVPTLFKLYCDLMLKKLSPIAIYANTSNVRAYDLEPLIIELGSEAITLLLDIIEKVGFKNFFNEEGTQAYKEFGAFTAENILATSATFLIAECKNITNDQIIRMQKILQERVDKDINLSITSTLSENIARVLHKLRPKLFPVTNLNPKTNHLDNPLPFLNKTV